MNTNRKKLYYEEYSVKNVIHLGMIEGWTSGNLNIDTFIKDTIYQKSLVDFEI